MSKELAENHDTSFAEAADANFEQASDAGGYLTFTKSGEWLMGQDEEPVDGLEVIINGKMLEQGWIRWGTKPPAKEFARIVKPYPEAPASVEGLDNDGRPTTFHAAKAYQFSGIFVEEGMDAFMFNTNSKGGMKQVGSLYREIIGRAKLSDFFNPKVRLESDSYKHTSYGKIYTPLFEIVSWHNQDGVAEGDAPKKLETKAKEPETTEEAPRKRRRTV